MGNQSAPAMASDASVNAALPQITALLLSEDQTERAPLLNVAQELVDDAMALPVPSAARAYELSGPGNYGSNAPVMLFLTILGSDNPELTSSGGVNVMSRALAHIRAAISDVAYPEFVGGHISWFDMYIPVAIGIARRTPSMWSNFNEEERARATLLMRHSLHTANMFCNTNSTAGNASTVSVDMRLSGSGFLPNQSASYHAYAIGSYVYFGGAAGMNPVLAAYDLNTFRSELRSADFDDVAALYDNVSLQRFLAGEKVSDQANPDPLGVKKPFIQLNTRSLERSSPGEEHPYLGANPLPATPARIFQRWGHDFMVGAMPQSNVGPSNNMSCDGIDFGLASGTIPYQGMGKGMPHELNTRSSLSGPHTRSSWDYSSWGMQQYMYLFAAVTMMGYWDLTDPLDQQIWERARRAVEIFRYIGDNKWISSVGPASEVCTSNHGDAYGRFSGLHWAQGLMDAILFSDNFVAPTRALVP